MRSASFRRGVVTLLSVGGLATSATIGIGVPRPLPVNAALVAHLAGMLAGYLSAVMLLLMSRAPVLERRVGSDTLVRWHSRGGRLFLGLVLTHAGAAVLAWAQLKQQALLPALVSVLSLPWLPAAAAGTGLFVVIAVGSMREARRRVSYESWHLLHLLTYVAISLSFLHELGGPNLAGHPAVQVAWTLMHVYALTLVFRFRLLRPLEDAWRHRLRVAAVVPEADGVVSIILRGRHLEELGAESGQFFRWRFLGASTWRTAHPFSLSAPRHGDYLRITVKALGEGSRRVQAVRPGTRVLAEGPSGAMTAARRTRPLVLLVAGGVGITPMRALFETIDADPGSLTLLYRASSPGDVVFREELEQIARERRAMILWLIGPSSSPHLQMNAENMLSLVPDLAERDVYLCASPRLSGALRSALKEAGLVASQLHEESFAF